MIFDYFVLQECLFYSGDVTEDQYYCSGSCASSPPKALMF